MLNRKTLEDTADSVVQCVTEDCIAPATELENIPTACVSSTHLMSNPLSLQVNHTFIHTAQQTVSAGKH